MLQNGRKWLLKVANIWINQKLIDEILADIENYSPLETGGAFFGYHSKNSDVVITHLIPVGPNAKHKRYSFEPDQEFQLKLMEELYFEKNASISYLGDWHSHPTNVSDSAQCQHPIMMIFGSCPEKWTINTVKFTEGKRYFWPLYKCNYEQMIMIID